MSFLFDHFVHVVNDPQKAIERCKELGIHAVQGGRHEDLGTYNALSYFGLSYIEFIDVFSEQLASEAAKVNHGLIKSVLDEKEEGAVRVALRSNDLQADAERFASLGLEVSGPTDFSRTRPDGSIIKWKLLFVGREGISPELPFFIEWDESDERRKQDLEKSNAIADHLIGDLTLESIGFAVENGAETAASWSKLLGVELGATFIDSELHATGYPLLLQRVNLIFYEPTDNGKVESFLQTKGEKPFMVQFSGGMKKTIDFSGALYRFR
ncbi:VOC family protein [Oceanobacillus sp. 1P07AA]|uniref:VOC family protein n=1 Tax=Oceanobacillus sp. 1P07AA TaxID=3132293 RepID=UPI0039A4EE16